MLKQGNLVQWLIDNGGEVVRYRAAKELTTGYPSCTLEELERDLLKSGITRYWLSCLSGKSGFNDIHGSRDECFENAMGKLSLFGLRKGMADLDQRCDSYLRLLNDSKNELNVIEVLGRTIVASLLALGGYLTEPKVQEWIEERLDTINGFVKNGNCLIYVDKSKFKGIPSAFRNYPLINPDLYTNGRFALPWIYDVFAFSVLLNHTTERGVKTKIARVISYILDSYYQQFHDGYGIVLTGKNHYNVMGWNVWLPRYNGMHVDGFNIGCLIQRLELMSHFRSALSSPWFMKNVDSLQDFAMGTGIYLFPKQYLQERKDSYFVTGTHMGLGENRRRKLAHKIESTFWMMKIMKNIASAYQKA